MRIGFIGLGKLGLPVALAIENAGHKVVGYDISAQVEDILETRRLPYKELGAQELLYGSKIKFMSPLDVVDHSEIVFLPVQTPHRQQYEGVSRLPETRADFDYSYLTSAFRTVAEAANELEKEVIVAIISTVLPGTIDREIRPLMNKYTKLVYTPQFIAMGTTIDDFLNPEFVPLGVDDKKAANTLIDFYGTLHNSPVYKTDIRTAELIKVSYNTFISTKIALANTWMELAHKTGADVDDLVDALSLADQRLISPKYLRGGMGDGGGCHPRDNIALSWLAQELDLSHDIFNDIMQCREDQTEWLANMAIDEAEAANLPIRLLGKEFKPETDLTVGSPAFLLQELIAEILPCSFQDEDEPMEPAVYVLSCMHYRYQTLKFPVGSVVIDPFRYIQEQKNVKLISIGSQQHSEYVS